MLREAARRGRSLASTGNDEYVQAVHLHVIFRVSEAVMRILAAIFLSALAFPSSATFHLWYVNEVYSNADGSVQYIEFKAAAAGQQYLKDHILRSSSGTTSKTYTFPSDLPGDSAEMGDPGGYGYGGYGMDLNYKSFLVATQGFAALNIVAPDYVVPNGFLFPAGGTLSVEVGGDSFTYGALPANSMAMTRDRVAVTPTPLNFFGMSGAVPAQTAAPSYQGLWLKTPFASENGAGINFTQQGTNLFATWFTYGTDGAGMWLVMSDGAQSSPGKFAGTLYRTTGPGFNEQTFTPITSSNYTLVGNLTVTFSDANTGSMTTTVNNVTQTRPIGRFIFALAPNCQIGGAAGTTPNYTDLWWRAGGTEGGWGVNVVHQGDILFATWFTYEAGGTASSPAKGMWLVMSEGDKTANGVYTGALQRTTGPNPFDNSVAFDPSKVTQTTVGSATFTFADANHGTFAYTVNGVTQSKPIERLSFSSPVTICK
jgi:hypothetical protein